MIINSLCNSCLQPFKLMLEPSDLPLVKQISDESGHTAACPKLCGGRINLVGDPVIHAMAHDKRLKEPLSLSGKELYKAVNGMGLPDEIPSSTELLNALFKAEKVKKVVTEVSNGRIYLHEIVMSDDSVIHLSAGIKGAQVLKVTKLIKKRRKANGTPHSN